MDEELMKQINKDSKISNEQNNTEENITYTLPSYGDFEPNCICLELKYDFKQINNIPHVTTKLIRHNKCDPNKNYYTIGYL